MKLLSMLMLLTITSILATECYSLPRFSLRTQKPCSSCHYNPTGGIIRNENGFYYGQNLLSMVSPRSDEFKMSPKLNDNISIGLDFRGQFLYSQAIKKADFQDMSGSVYANIMLSKEINIISRYDFVQKIWEAYGITHILPNNGYVKGGAFQPYYGLRIDDHTSYTRGGDFALLRQSGARAGLIFNPFYVEAGLELGLYISDFAFFTTSMGSDVNTQTFSEDLAYTARLEFNPKVGNKVGLLLGGSYAAAKDSVDFYGGFGGVAYNRFTLLAEFDRAKNLTGSNINSNLFMAQATYVIIIGLEAYLRYDWMDPNVNADNDETAHLILGFEFVPYSFIEFRPQYRFLIEEPSVANNAIVFQFHIYY